ncbi:hypothetical protein [Candidatus Aciduliprofundum boonei]|uniref:Uncharacterized protein n=1 Tax=Aciduliprofundum boonei (strain DSM 19572 / T469) TaxID=439481 RepID=B5IHM0_ACIB4|nr:hypothetical protein [Candidatus Aciduliprofundum boonei]ADD08807.1 hypothetical protein Aboo_0998 [Aciduliprofundum boonei T469]EDY34225.1 hypothetical protein ABOONEI_2451 [Aciduliprofundum boonei T469]HII55420.1 hypothetical protein [Candidatus Aciduliprofundum boonei]
MEGGANKNVTLENILKITGVSKEYLQNIADELYERGITSKLMDKTPYLEVFDDHEFKEYLIERLKDVEEKIVKLCSY